MKYIYLFLIGFLFFSCGKEDTLKNEIDFSNIYAITDDPNDPVQHERYQIFSEFGVSVYFNDTVNQEFGRTDVYGNPVYRYELIDPTWLFYKPESGTGNTQVEYKFVYAKGEEKQLKILTGIRQFLENISEALYPTLIMSADSIYKINSAGEIEEETSFETNFRVMLWCRVDEIVDDGSLDNTISNIEKTLVLDKVENFTSKIDEFGTISEATNYGKDLFVYPTSDPWIGYGGYYFSYGRPASMEEDYLEDLKSRWPSWAEEPPTQEHVDESRSVFASIVGPYGFVGTSTFVITTSPNSVTIDLNEYVELMLRFSPEEFQKYFGDYSLVMKKYNILYEVIVNEMGVEL